MIEREMCEKYIGKFVEFGIRINNTEESRKGEILQVGQHSVLIKFYNNEQVYAFESLLWLREMVGFKVKE